MIESHEATISLHCKTSAAAQGLTDHEWTIEELLENAAA